MNVAAKPGSTRRRYAAQLFSVSVLWQCVLLVVLPPLWVIGMDLLRDKPWWADRLGPAAFGAVLSSAVGFACYAAIRWLITAFHRLDRSRGMFRRAGLWFAFNLFLYLTVILLGGIFFAAMLAISWLVAG